MGRAVAVPDRRTKYPWEKWMDGKEHIAVHGKDFTCGIPSFVTLLHQKVGRFENVSHVETNVQGTKVVFMYFLKPGAEA